MPEPSRRSSSVWDETVIKGLLVITLAAKVVWLDVDPAVLRGGHEPDDGLALLQSFHSPELEVRGVSVVFGNSALEQGYPNGQEIVKRFGPKGLEVYNGAASRGAPP